MKKEIPHTEDELKAYRESMGLEAEETPKEKAEAKLKTPKENK